jgi:hypothetical protein
MLCTIAVLFVACFLGVTVALAAGAVAKSQLTALLLLFCARAVFASDVTKRPLVEFRGNVLFDELLYRSVLDLPDSARATPAEARAVSAKLLGLLRRAGYDLGVVRASVQGEQIMVEIDEGRLDKIIVLGQGLMETFRLKLELSMPGGVFNRPLLERQLRALAQRYQLRHYSYELVPTQVRESYGPQIEELEPPPSVPGFRPGQHYELRIVVASSPWSRGFAPDLSIGSPEGLGGGGHYREQDVFAPDDRWEVRVRLAGAIRQHLDSTSSRPVLTRAFADGRWFSPPVITESLRPALTVRADLLSLQRADLRLDRFDQATFAASFDASVFRPSLLVALGVGIERRFLVGLVKAIGANPSVDETPRAQTRPYAEALADLVFNPGELRTDRKHTLDVEGRLYFGSPSSDEAVWLRATYQRHVPIGWHELGWQVRGTLLTGQVLFPDEESLGGHLHGAFGLTDFARKLGSAGVEFRYSLLRDVFKVGLFYDQALFGALDRMTGIESVNCAGAGGPALHLLLADQFQIDAYLAMAWNSVGTTDLASTLMLRQVF